ncbi:MAG: CRISPR-associated protein Cas4 [Candidatus Ozemobacteraceae bacterium]
MYSEDDLLMISGIQHLAFCARQWGLIHIEGQWEENRLTVEGKQLHEKTDEDDVEIRPGMPIVRGLRIRSLRLGLIGRCDVVEFHAMSEAAPVAPKLPLLGTACGKLPPGWRPYPVEYKRGRPKVDHCDDLQLCAQALCLEEMLGCAIPEGAPYYGTPRRRSVVSFDDALRNETADVAKRLHQLVAAGCTPPVEAGPKCRNCSLKEACQPGLLSHQQGVEPYLKTAFADREGSGLQ